MSDYNIDLGEWGVSSVPALMAKIVGYFHIEHSVEIESRSALSLIHSFHTDFTKVCPEQIDHLHSGFTCCLAVFIL